MKFFRTAGQTLALTVGCPACAAGTLIVHRSCVSTSLSCSGCKARFAVGDLAATLDEDAFAQVAAALGDRLADRV